MHTRHRDDSAGDADYARTRTFPQIALPSLKRANAKEEIWRVRGSGNADRTIEGPGPFLMEVQKRDARVLDLWFEWILDTPPGIDELLRATRK